MENDSMFIGDRESVRCEKCGEDHYPIRQFHTCDPQRLQKLILETLTRINMSDTRPTKVQTVTSIGIDQLIDALDLWREKAHDGECSMRMAERLESIARNIRDKAIEASGGKRG